MSGSKLLEVGVVTAVETGRVRLSAVIRTVPSGPSCTHVISLLVSVVPGSFPTASMR